MGVRRVCVVLASLMALTLAACSSGSSGEATPTTAFRNGIIFSETTTTLPLAVPGPPRVMGIDAYPNPEGPAAHFTALTNPGALDAAGRVWPARLPPSSGHQECIGGGGGGTVVLTLNDGSTRRYGPCTKPVAVQRGLNVFYEFLEGPTPEPVVPDVVGDLVPGAWAAVAARRLLPDLPPDAPMTWQVVAQRPRAGSQVPFNTLVHLELCPSGAQLCPANSPTGAHP